MIALTENLPALQSPDPVLFKLHALRDCYADIALFWAQEESGALLGFLDGHLLLFCPSAVDEELKNFVAFLSPQSIFSTEKTLLELGLSERETVFVMAAESRSGETEPSDEVSSREVYDLLSDKGFDLPDYPSFAVDLCRRINHGTATVFLKRKKGVAVTFVHGDFAFLNGIASHEKGFGSRAVQSVLCQQFPRTVFCCCRAEITKFYEKNGFSLVGQAAYWVKNR